MLRQTVKPTKSVISVEEIKTHLRIDDAFEDLYLLRKIAAATRQIERHEWRQLLTATFELTLDGFPRGRQPILLPRPPLQSITSIEYIDTAGVAQTLAVSDYILFERLEPAEILPASTWWPDVTYGKDAVTVTYVAGYGDDPEDVPETTRTAIEIMVGFLLENRDVDGVIPRAVDALIEPVRDARLAAFVEGRL